MSMRKRSADVEWHIAENEEEWQTLRQEHERASGEPTDTASARWLTTVVLITLTGLGLWQWQSRYTPISDTTDTTISTDINTIEDATEEAQSIENTIRYTSNPMAAHGGPFNHDVARMLERPEWGIHAYQQVDESLRPMLANALWGAERELESNHFHFRFRQRDAKTVEAAAPELDLIYEELWQSWGVPIAPTTKIAVQISEQYVRSDLPYLPRYFDKLTISSPALYPTIEPWTQTDLFIQSVVLLLIDQLLAEAVDFYAIGTARDPVLEGLRLWQLWDLALPIAEQKARLLHWIYVDLPTWQPESDLPVPDNYERLCTIHTLWMSYPAQLQIPILCTEQDRSPLRFAPEVLHHPPTELPWLHNPHYVDEEADGQLRMRLDPHPGEVLALAMLFDYLTTEHGRGKLPDLLTKLNRYRSWDNLLPAVYTVSKETIENGWQLHLRFP